MRRFHLKYAPLLLAIVLLSFTADHRPDAAPPDVEEAQVMPFTLQFAEDERFPFVNDPRGVAAAPSGWYVLDAGNYRVLQVTPSGDVRRTFGTEGSGPGELLDPRSLRVVDTVGDGYEVWVMDHGNGRLVRFGPDGLPVAHHGLRSSGSFCVHAERFLVAAPRGPSLMDAYDLQGTYIESLGPMDEESDGARGTGNPYLDNEVSLTCLADGQVVVTYRNRPLVRLLSADGAIAQEWTLESPIIDLILTPPRQPSEAGIESLRPSGGPLFVPLMFGDPTLLPDGRLLIALQSAAFHTLDLATGAQQTYAYMDLLSAVEEQREIAAEDWRALWHVGVSAEGTLVAVDPQLDELVVVELVD
ncbi:MAG: hypothetical protein GVY15_07255 [Bacteroidetes bacterium]|jgi:hypothetical protein|nr:hypothetical protein [Bacteroidota bacterium]